MRHSMRAVGRAVAILATVLGTVALTACGSSDDHTPAAGPQTINVRFSGNTVTPNGEVVNVDRGQKVKLEVRADKAGEIHVHSDPERQYPYGAGTTSISLGSFDVPGRIEIESHALNKTIVILQVQ